MQIFASTTFLGTGRSRVTEVVTAMKNMPLDGIELGSTHCFEASEVIRRIREIWPGRLLTHNFFPASADESLVLNLAAVEPEHRQRSLEHCRQSLAMAAELGAEIYTVHPGFMASSPQATTTRSRSHFDFSFGDERIPYETAFGMMLDSLAHLQTFASERSVTLAVETEGSVTKQGVLLLERPEELDRLFAVIPDIKLNFNLAHTSLAARVHGFDVGQFVDNYKARFAAVELSHNDGRSDQHAPLTSDSYVLSWLGKLPDVPWILEFRDSSVEDLANSAELIRSQLSD